MTTFDRPTGQDFARIFAWLEGEFNASADGNGGTRRVGLNGVPWLENEPQSGAHPNLWTETLAWLDLGDEPPIVEPPRPADAATIGSELGLAQHLSAADLNRIRRAFALRNHPDLCAPEDRELANQRMRIANMLIDAALDQLGRRER